MSITSFYFLCFYVLVFLVYYLVPKKLQWPVLLAASVVFYLLSGNVWLIAYPIGIGTVCFGGGYVLAKLKARKAKRAALSVTMSLTLCGTMGVLFVLKYVNFFIGTFNGIVSLFQGPAVGAESLLSSGAAAIAGDFAAGPSGFALAIPSGFALAIPSGFALAIPLGISFYTLSMLGYVIDIYYDIGRVSKNYLQFLLYGLFFPTMISGPVMRYNQMADELYKPHSFDYVRVTKGLQRMLWGFFKKLVISERAAVLVNAVYNDYGQYEGAFFWMAAIFFVVQLYTDFSGCMDIVLGLGETFGITLPENFRTPFLSRSISEYWRRWHITLGTFMKDFVFFPLLRSQVFSRLGNFLKKHWGKKRGKQFTTFAAMFILWFMVGIWHGGEWKYVLSSGLFHWAFIVLGELAEPVFARFMARRGLNAHSRLLDGLRIIRTFMLVMLADVFFRADSVAVGFRIWKSMFTVWNPGDLFSRLFTLGLDGIEFIILIVSLIIFAIVSVRAEKAGVSMRDRIAVKPLPVRWLIWYALLFYTILLGYYGPEFSAAEFIYQGF